MLEKVKHWYNDLMGYTPIIEHEILNALRSKAATVTQTGNEKNGYTPLDHFELPTARMHYGTLVAVLNHPEKYLPVEGNPTNYQTIILKRHEIIADKYTFPQCRKAIEILMFNKHVKQETDGGWVWMENRIIIMTEEGLMALNTDWYKNNRIETRYKARLPMYTRLTIFFAALAAFGAITAAYYAQKQVEKNTPIIINPPPQRIPEIRITPIDTLKVKTVTIQDLRQK